MRICLTTAFNEAYREMGSVCVGSLERWAAAADMTLRVHDSLPDTGRPPAWAKIPVIHRLFDEGFDYVLWVDTDAVVVRPEADIRTEIVPDRDLYLVKHRLTGDPMPGVTVILDVPNTGVMLLRNSPWTIDFLGRVWAKKEYAAHRWWENAAVIDILGYHRLLDGAAVNTPVEEELAHVQWLDCNWNTLPGECEGEAPIIRHHTRATDYAARVAAMRADLGGG
jgi:hypothetical protein